MTDKEFVLSLYPNAYFSCGTIYEDERNCLNKLWEDDYGKWAEEWLDQTAIDEAWKNAAATINRRILRKLQS